MVQPSTGELASTNPTTRAQDARFQDHRIGTKISLSACSSSQHLRRPTSSHIGKNAPSLQDIGDADMARSRRRGVIPDGTLSASRALIATTRVLGGVEQHMINRVWMTIKDKKPTAGKREFTDRPFGASN
jgi:hypothetical protein